MAVKNKAIAGLGRAYMYQSLVTVAFLALLGVVGYTLTMIAER